MLVETHEEGLAVPGPPAERVLETNAMLGSRPAEKKQKACFALQASHRSKLPLEISSTLGSS